MFTYQCRHLGTFLSCQFYYNIKMSEEKVNFLARTVNSGQKHEDRRFYTNRLKMICMNLKFVSARTRGILASGSMAVNYGKDIRVGFSRFFCLTYINLPFRCGGVRENKIDEQLALINAKHPLGCYIKDWSRNSIVQLDSDSKGIWTTRYCFIIIKSISTALQFQ